MTRTRPTASAAVALAAAGILLAACTDAGDGAPDSADAVTPTSAEPTPSETTPSPDGWTPIPLDYGEDLLPEGRLGLTANGRPDMPWAVVDVAGAFSTIGGWVVFDEGPQGGGGVSYWTISEVVRNPCSAPDPHPIEAGTTVDEVAATFRQQRLTRVTTPAPVTVDGHHGLSLELHVPDDIDFDTCAAYQVWESDPAGARHMERPGQFDILWILDVEGEVVVLAVSADPDIPQPAVDRLTDMVESAEFVART